MAEEWFNLVNENDEVIGKALRSECHGNPELIHRAAHVVVYSGSRILLQKRSMNKDIQPGKWDTAVGGHLGLNEGYEEGVRREMEEELGIPFDSPISFLFDSKIRNEMESENIRVFSLEFDGPFTIQKEEIDEIRFFSSPELHDPLWRKEFTPNLLKEIDQLSSIKFIPFP